MANDDYFKDINAHGGDRSKAAVRFSMPNDRLIDFSSNINPLGLHPVIETVIRNNINRVLYYPDPDCGELRKVLSGYYGIDKQKILAGNGSAELIDLLARTLEPGQALIPEPNFSEYARSLLYTGTKIIRVYGNETAGFKTGADDLAHAVTNNLDEGGAVFISNPNNPAGYMYTREELETVLEACERKQCYLIVDEAFIQFTAGAGQESMADRVRDSQFLAVLQAFTKIFAVPGLRLGMVLANPELIEKMAARQVRWSVNGLAQAVGTVLLNEKQYLDDTVVYTKKEREKITGALEAVPGVQPFRSEANYILNKITSSASLHDLEEYLGAQGVLIRNCSNYYGLDHRFFRIAVRDKNENQRLLELLRVFFRQHTG